MGERRTSSGKTQRSGHEEVRELLRTRWVQAVLAVTVVFSAAGAATTARGADEASSVGGIPAAVAQLPAAVASAPAETLQEAWLERAVERESHALSERYLAQGYQLSPELAAQIQRAAAEHDIETEVAFGLVRAESSFKNSATSPVGAVGLTQLMPSTARWLEPGVTRQALREPATNLRIGFRYLRSLIDKYEGDTSLALTAYNRGPGTVDKALKRGQNPDNGYADFVYGKANHGHRLYTSR
ncbi:MAG TPA: lytic transglycosylase domain-containing protein [Longimicrobiaceae bacterium]|nr:lytic transglycosylase domain-containing protein [Longimicrobiaceae bacterium]